MSVVRLKCDKVSGVFSDERLCRLTWVRLIIGFVVATNIQNITNNITNINDITQM